MRCIDLWMSCSRRRLTRSPLQLVVTIMLVSLFVNRDRKFHIIPSPDSSSESLMKSAAYEETISQASSRSASPEGRQKPSMDLSQSPFVSQSDSNMNFPSRILQRFPFLVEMFYWALNFLAYAMTKKIGAALYSRNEHNEVTELAQQHGIAILNIEHNSMFKIFFPITEVSFQRFFVNNHVGIITLFNQFYSLVHIPGTVAYVLPFLLHEPPALLTRLS